MPSSRAWREKERKREKKIKVTNWHKSQLNHVSAPLIIDPTAGSMTKEIKEVWAGLGLGWAGESVKDLAKA